MKMKLLALGCCLMCLTSCLDIVETFNLKEDGSGTYEIKMDMSRALGMMAMMKQGASDGKEKQKVDTTIYNKSVTDTSTILNQEEKTVLSKSYTKVHMDESEGEGYVTMYYPFANGKELEIVQNSMSKVTNDPGVKNALGQAFGKEMNTPAAGQGPASNLPTSDFIYSLTGNHFTRTVKPANKADEPKTADEQIPEGLKEMFKMNYTTSINLPRAARSFKGAGKLSDDKKKITFIQKLDMDAKPTPADFDFSIDY